MIFSFFYNTSLLFLILLYSPRAIYLYFFKGKYKASLRKRLGQDFPFIDKKNKPLAWIHAVSVGETRAVMRLCKNLSEKYTLLISSTTETGYAESKRSLSFADYHVFLPIDLSWIIRPIVKRVLPDVLIFSETDLWFQLLKVAKENGAKTFVVNGKISEQSKNRLKLFPFFTKRLYSLIDFFCLQNSLYKDFFSSLGVPENKIAVMGNLKFDDEKNSLENDALIAWKMRLGINSETKVLVIGSTHDPEEKIILDAIEPLMNQYPHLKVILVPRHPERFDTIEKELLSRKLSFCVFSKTKKCLENLVLVDAMGVLRSCYQIADVAIVAGSFTEKVGGHNILEPLLYGVPVIFGPHMHGQPDLLKIVLEYKAGIQVHLSQMAKTIDEILNQPELKLALTEAGLTLMKESSGSTTRTLKCCHELISNIK